MTRFARAKGSKSCNDKVPEQASSWAELKKSVQLKTESAEELPGEIVNRIKSKPATKEPIKWAPLDVDTVESNFLLIREHHRKNNVKTNDKSLNDDSKNVSNNKLCFIYVYKIIYIWNSKHKLKTYILIYKIIYIKIYLFY